MRTRLGVVRTSARKPVAAACLCVLTIAVAGGCTSSKHASPSGAGAGAKASTSAATRWWSNAAVHQGSTVNPNDPSAAAAALHPSQTDYCGMLRETLANTKVLPGLESGDAKLAVAAKAFVAEIEQVAPTNLQGDWRQIAPILIGVSQSGVSGTASADTTTLQAAQAIAADAKTNCGLDLTKVIAH